MKSTNWIVDFDRRGTEKESEIRYCLIFSLQIFIANGKCDEY